MVSKHDVHSIQLETGVKSVTSSTVYPSQHALCQTTIKWTDTLPYLAIIPTSNSAAIIKLYQVDQTIFRMASALDISTARSRFPALQQEQVYMDNAGEVDLHFIAPENFEIRADC